MIHYLATREHAYTMASYLGSWGRGLASRVRIVAYEDVLAGAGLPERGAAFIFSDLDRLDVTARAVLGRLCDHLVERCGADRVLNHPRLSLPRLDLLRDLHRRGINRFAAWGPGETPERFPVFLREAEDYRQQLPALIRTPAQYRARVDGVSIAIEFCDTMAPTGVYRKYGAFVVGGRILPRHLFFSRRWFVKEAELAEPALLAEECCYVEENPHEAALLEAVRGSRIGYGRIDYGLLDGRPQIWEINTNPLVASFDETVPGRAAVHRRFAASFAAALSALDA